MIVAGIYFLPTPEEKKKQDFLASLVTPEEARPPEIKPLAFPPPANREAKPDKQAMRPRSMPHPPVRGRNMPPIPATPPRDTSQDRPVVPGEGSDIGSPLPRDKQPGTKPEIGPEPKSEMRTESSGKTGRPSDAPKKGVSTRSKLFDPMITSEIAVRDATSKPGKDDSITFETRDYRYAGYMRKLRDKIQSIWTYPPAAAAEGKYGDLKIRFTIKKDGTLAKIELERTSGYKMLDDAAIKALKDGEPYWPLPDEWGTETYTILGHFIYSLHGYQRIE